MDDVLRPGRVLLRVVGILAILIAIALAVAAQQFIATPTLRRWQCGIPFAFTAERTTWALCLTFAGSTLWALARSSREKWAPRWAGWTGLVLLAIAAALTLVVIVVFSPDPNLRPGIEGCVVTRVNAFAIGLLILTPLVALVLTHIVWGIRQLPGFARVALTIAVNLAVWVPYLLVVEPYRPIASWI